MKRKHVIVKNSDQNEEVKKAKLPDGVEALFHANLYKLQIQQLLSEVKIANEKKVEIEEYISQLKSVLTSIPEDKIHCKISDVNLLQGKSASLPLVCPATIKGTFRFVAIKKVFVVGSLAIDTFNRRHGKVDIAVEIPQECMQDKDYLNERYLIKRAFYLSYIADHLQRSNLADRLDYSHHHGCKVKPVLLIKPSVQSLKHLTIVVHVCLAQDTFKLNRFHISKNNIRSQWFVSNHADLDSIDESKDESTPHYNTWMLADMTMQSQNSYLERVFGGNQNIKDGIELLKVWLHQRELDVGFGCINGFIISMFVAYLFVKNKLTTAMSNYHVFRKTLTEIVQQDWCTNPISLVGDESSSDTANLPTLDDFRSAFQVVFIDVTGYVNLCADVSLTTYQLLKHEAQFSVSYMDSANAFQALFMTPVTFSYRCDQIFQIRSLDVLKTKTINSLNLGHALVDYCGDFVNACLPHFMKLLLKALGDRVKLVMLKHSDNAVWEVSSSAPDSLQQDSLWFGLVIDPQQSTVTLDLGPFGGTSEAEEFRAFWKEKSELRRFPDGSIREAVYWPSDTLADKRMVCCRIVKHILTGHAGISADNIRYLANQGDTLLRPHFKTTAGDDSKETNSSLQAYGTGEEQQAAIITSCDDLVKQLHKAVAASDSLHLTINSVHGISPVFRYTEVFPALPVRDRCKTERCGNRLVPLSKDGSQCPMYAQALSVVCLLEGSGKWPEDVEAIRRLKANYYLELGRSLNKSTDGLLVAAYTDHLDVCKDGYVFRLIIGFNHEIVLHKKQVLPDGKLKLSDNDEAAALEYQYNTLPRLTSCLHGLHLQHNSFGAAVRLSKRWLASQMFLGDYISEEAVELIVASLYISAEPFSPPGSPLVGFRRFLRLISTHDWQSEPLIVNINNELTQADYTDIQAKFTKERSTLPIMFLSTPFDKYSQIWTKKKPSVPILQRLARLANEACLVLEQIMMKSAGKSDLKQIFRTSLSHFDVVVRVRDTASVRRHCAIEGQSESLCCTPFTDLKARGKELWSVVDYDPVRLYLDELRIAFDDIALFFYDVYGGSVIGVVWKPQALQQERFTLSRINCRLPKPNAAGKELNMVLDKNAILEDFWILGRGLIADIGVYKTDSNFVSLLTV